MSIAVKILLVEDHDEDINICRSSVKKYERQNQCEIQLIEHKKLEDAIMALDNSFDGAIIDLNLKGEEGGIATYQGNEVIQTIQDDYRIPVAIFTGTPEQVENENPGFLGVYKKGETEYVDLFSEFVDMYKTGITKIFAGRGVIESAMQEIFWKNILPQIDAWKNGSYSADHTESSLLRFTLNHLTEKLDHDFETCLPEEMYISPPPTDQVKTGSLVKCAIASEYHIVLSPACDLAIRGGGSFKAERVLVCDIEDFAPLRDKELDRLPAEKRKARHKRTIIENLIKNNWKINYHWLPAANDFMGGMINFRKTVSYSPEEFELSFEKPKLQITSPFIKDIVARYSAFYARQGQPDFDFSKLAKELMPPV